jgi:predicted aspartyl protease
MAIQGKVTAARETVIVLQPVPKKRKISVIVDTGFSGELYLSPSIIRRLGLERVGREANNLADGQIVHRVSKRREIELRRFASRAIEHKSPNLFRSWGFYFKSGSVLLFHTATA